MFFHYNSALGPPYHILLDTNFINFSIQNKLEVVQAAMDCLYAKCTPCITDCVMAELEKLGPKYRVALRYAPDPATRLRRPADTAPPCPSPGSPRTHASSAWCARTRAPTPTTASSSA